MALGCQGLQGCVNINQLSSLIALIRVQCIPLLTLVNCLQWKEQEMTEAQRVFVIQPPFTSMSETQNAVTQPIVCDTAFQTTPPRMCWEQSAVKDFTKQEHTVFCFDLIPLGKMHTHNSDFDNHTFCLRICPKKMHISILRVVLTFPNSVQSVDFSKKFPKCWLFLARSWTADLLMSPYSIEMHRVSVHVVYYVYSVIH